MNPESQQMLAQLVRLVMASGAPTGGSYTGPSAPPSVPLDFFQPVTQADIQKWTK